MQIPHGFCIKHINHFSLPFHLCCLFAAAAVGGAFGSHTLILRLPLSSQSLGCSNGVSLSHPKTRPEYAMSGKRGRRGAGWQGTPVRQQTRTNDTSFFLVTLHACAFLPLSTCGKETGQHLHLIFSFLSFHFSQANFKKSMM